MNNDEYLKSRRQFLRRSVALSAAGIAPLAYQLEAIAAMAAHNPDDPIQPKAALSGGNNLASTNPNYKALVCLFLYGGNDCANFVIPYDSAYAQYATDRSNLAIAQFGNPADPSVNLRGLLPLGPLANQAGRLFAFHPNVGVKAGAATTDALMADGLPALWKSGKLALVVNTGPLVVPMLKADYTQKKKPAPQNLFSHSDQQVMWMNSTASGYSSTGVGGRLADVADTILEMTNTPPPGQPKIATCISIAGVNPYQVADNMPSYQINTSGTVGLSPIAFFSYGNYVAINSAITTAFNDQIGRARTNLFEKQWTGMMSYSLQTKTAIDTALAANPLPATATFRTSGNNLSSQLKMVARLINASTDLGMKRQVFFVQIGGFDVHGVEFHPQNNSNWNKISEAVYDFNNAMVQINGQNQVTLFSSSDFGRTLDSNGAGSDHGWGAHHFVTGGAVNGGAMYGTFPTVALNSSDDIGRGALLPTTSTDQFHATLARWFGLTDAQVQTVLPNYLAFSPNYLGFV